ncbi:MAG: HD domain-containing protein, partial [Candidatus Thorarchaeota archaeon]|nr:HD domain-containing protein [Candidatus Thorarchaeota archaeon]
MPPSAVTKLQSEVNKAVKVILTNYHPRPIRANKVIRDTAFGFNSYYPHEINLLDSPLLQRLRGIRQTSLACYTYPSAVHTRFEHSLGATVIVGRMIEALRNRESALVSNPVDCAEARMAALLHDIGHGPFSHGTEIIFQEFDEIKNVKKEKPELFKDNAAHEILSYFIVNSSSFKEKWEEIKTPYLSRSDYKFNISGIDINKVALMILGKHPNPDMYFFAQMVNGPHDADKFDYVTRDGYFTGLRTAINIDRFLLSIGTSKNDKTKIRSLCVDISGVT